VILITKGRVPGFPLAETFWKMRWTVALLIFAIIYHLSVRFGGAEYNFLANFVTDMVDRFGLDKSR
jgi:Na+/pantothenate symporter